MGATTLPAVSLVLVALTGDEAGMQLGASGECVVSTGSPVPKAVVGVEGHYDFVLLAESMDPEFFAAAPDGHRAVSPMHQIGPATAESPEFHLVSSDLPLSSFVKDLPPELEDHTWDGTMTTFEAALLDAGYTVSTTIYPGKPHMEYIMTTTNAAVVDLIVEVAYE